MEPRSGGSGEGGGAPDGPREGQGQLAGSLVTHLPCGTGRCTCGDMDALGTSQEARNKCQHSTTLGAAKKTPAGAVKSLAPLLKEET